MPRCAQLIEELHPHQVNLSVIRPGRPHSSDKSMSNMSASMGVTFHAVIFDKGNLLLSPFAKRMLRVAGNSDDHPILFMHARHKCSEGPRTLGTCP
jgi:hypothetical protein